MNAPSPLRTYVIEKQALAASLIDLKELLENTAAVDDLQELLVKLAQDRFHLVVVGQFKRGKSSLMNAILARDLLPTGYLPLTSAITALCYGPKDRAVLHIKGWTLEKEIELSELREYITEEGNPGNERGLLYAQIEVPAAFLRRGLYFIDTPGIGSSRHENTQTTYEYLPQADAIIFVTSVEAPLSEPEEQFLRDIQPFQRKLFVVVNKTDLVDPQELPAVTGYIHAALQKILGQDAPRLFPLSAKRGMQAKLGRDDSALHDSGLHELESTLEDFLAEEKELSFLVAMVDRSLQLIDQATPKISVNGKAARVGEIQNTLRTIRAELTGEAPSATAPVRVIEPGLAAARDEVMQKIARKEQEKAEQLISRNTCSVCVAQSRAIFDYFASYQYELTRSPEVTETFLARKGFCHFHTWQFAQIASPQGVSAGYVLLIDAVLRELQESLEKNPAAEASLAEEARCPACQFLRELETDQLRQLAVSLQDREQQEQYAQSGGLCLPHMSLLLRTVDDERISSVLLETQVRRFEELSEDLRNYLLKRTAIQRSLLNSEEQSAWMRALVKMVGERTVFHR